MLRTESSTVSDLRQAQQIQNKSLHWKLRDSDPSPRSAVYWPCDRLTVSGLSF